MAISTYRKQRKKGYKINAKCDLNLKLVCLLEYYAHICITSTSTHISIYRVFRWDENLSCFIYEQKHVVLLYCVCVLLATSYFCILKY